MQCSMHYDAHQYPTDCTQNCRQMGEKSDARIAMDLCSSVYRMLSEKESKFFSCHLAINTFLVSSYILVP